MRVWLITIGEPLPSDGTNERLLRTGLLAEQMGDQGHEVLWWTSSFDHVRKKQRSTRDVRITVRNGYDIFLLATSSYSRNVSFRRMMNHRDIARKFRLLAQREALPDVIVCSWPLVELCAEAVRYGDAWGVPVVLDYRDMWPDAIVDLVPGVMRRLARLALHRTYNQATFAASHAAAVTGITEKIVDWGLGIAGRERSNLDRAFPMAYREQAVGKEDLEEGVRFWRSHGIDARKSKFVACFFGCIGRHFEFKTILDAADRLKRSGRDIKFVLCGDGPQLSRWRRLAAGDASIIFPGWVDGAKIRSLMDLSSVGLAPYLSSWDFQMSIPNKPIEYMSAGLPVVSSLRGTLAELLAESGAGVTYENGNSEDLATVLTRCYDCRSELDRMSSGATRLYQRRFVAETVYAEMGDYLLEVVDAYRPKQDA